MNRKITRHILYFVKGAGGGGGGGGAQGRPGACNANGLAQAEQTLFQHNHSSQSKGLWGAEMRQDREQKNVIYKASADWNLSSDPLAAAQLICSWFQTTPPGRPEGTFFRFYAWIYLFNSPFTKTTADDSTNQSLWRKRLTHTLSLTHTRTHTRYPGIREPPPSSLQRTGLFSPGGSGKEKWRGKWPEGRAYVASQRERCA